MLQKENAKKKEYIKELEGEIQKLKKVILLMKICGNFLMKMELNWMKNILKEL